jgi:hypothetical protein
VGNGTIRDERQCEEDRRQRREVEQRRAQPRLLDDDLAAAGFESREPARERSAHVPRDDRGRHDREQVHVPDRLEAGMHEEDAERDLDPREPGSRERGDRDEGEDHQLEGEDRQVCRREIRTLELAEVAGRGHAEMVEYLGVQADAARVHQRRQPDRRQRPREERGAAPLVAITEDDRAQPGDRGEHPDEPERGDEAGVDVAPEDGEQRQPHQDAARPPPLLHVFEDVEREGEEEVREDVRGARAHATLRTRYASVVMSVAGTRLAPMRSARRYTRTGISA